MILYIYVGERNLHIEDVRRLKSKNKNTQYVFEHEKCKGKLIQYFSQTVYLHMRYMSRRYIDHILRR